MNNAEKFQEVFGCYATEIWAKPESMFLEWINSDYTYTPTIDIVRCKECTHCQDEVIEETMPIYIYCDLWKGETEWDSFCSYGEKKG